MKSSIEAKVAASIAAAFIALSAIAMSLGNGDREPVGSNGYGPTSNRRANTHMTQQEDDSYIRPSPSFDTIRL